MKVNRNLKHIVAIGASAGGLDPLQDFVSSLDVKKAADITFLIAQHMSSNYKSMLGQLLGRKTKIPISEIKQNQKMETGTIYIIPTEYDIDIDKNLRFKLIRSKQKGPMPSVNRLFGLLSARFGKKCVGILFSGTGDDGAQGLTAIKEKGGVTIVQEPATAKYEGMPTAGLATGNVDNVADPKQMGRKLLDMIGGKKLNTANKSKKRNKAREGTVSSILQKLEARLGTDFNGYKMSTIKRRLNRRMSDKKIKNLREYDKLIRENPQELDILFQYMLIGVTNFFRDPEPFKKLQDVLALIVNNKEEGDEIRIWVPACASGEEAYSLAMMLSKTVAASRKKLSINIFATDIDPNILAVAREGKYDEKTVENIPKEYIKRFFHKKGAKYLVNKEIKDLLLFSRHDITTNPPFLNLDLISCRNLLIYFNQELQGRIIPVLHYALKPNAYLFLGKSENIVGFKDLFATVDTRSKIFKKRPVSSPVFKYLHPKTFEVNKVITPAEEKEDKTYSLEVMVKETLVQSFHHPYVIIDEDLEIIELHGEVENYLKIKAGYPSNNILRLVVKDLQLELRAVSSKAIANDQPAFGRTRKVKINGDTVFVKISVKPLQLSGYSPYFMVIFEKIEGQETLLLSNKARKRKKGDPVVQELEHELNASKEHMNTLVEQMETSNEELQALNEELQSSNEELQASNEELETSNEELHAANEELEIAYAELETAKEEIEHKNQKIKQSENNLKTLINNTLQGFILVGADYKIIIFNKTAATIYKNIFGTKLSMGASYFDVIPSKSLGQFHDHFHKALNGETVSYEELEISTKTGTKYIEFNYSPVEKENHPTSPDYICISFLDRTSQRVAEKERDRLFALSIDLFTVMHRDGKILQANNAWEKQLQYFRGDVIGANIKTFVHPDDFKEVNQQWESLKTNKTAHIEFRLKHENGTFQWFSWNITAGKEALYCVAHDISQEKKDKELLEITNELGKIGGWEYEPESGKFHLAKVLCDRFGLPKIENHLWKHVNKILRSNKNKTIFKAHLENVAKSKEPFELELETQNHHGEKIWIYITGIPVKKERKVLRLIGTIRDVSEDKQHELELRAAKKKAEEMNELKSSFLANMSHEIRTPLNGILGMAQLIEIEEDKETIYKYGDRIMNSGKRLLDTINGILDLSKIESQEIEPDIEKVNVHETIRNVLKDVQALAKEKNIYLSTQFNKKTIHIKSDKKILKNILTNLIGNAIKFTEKGGVIVKTRYGRKDGEKAVKIEVKDTGIGISKKFLPKVFDIFTQEKDGNGSFKGSGLGLSLTKRFVEKLNGDISVFSKAKAGTTFAVLLPVEIEANEKT